MIEMVGERIARQILNIRRRGDKPLPYENKTPAFAGRFGYVVSNFNRRGGVYPRPSECVHRTYGDSIAALGINLRRLLEIRTPRSTARSRV